MSVNTGKTIEHKGFIERIRDNSILIKIVSESACADCHAKGACSAADMQEKEIEVQDSSGAFYTGEMVSVVIRQSQGFKALLIGYVYPFIILFAGLLTADAAGMRELHSGLIAVGLLIPYYFFIFLFRKRIQKGFNFSIHKIK